MVNAALELDVGLILAGHTHEPRAYWADENEKVRVICGGSMSAYLCERGLHIQEISLDVSGGKVDVDTVACRLHSYDDEYGHWDETGINL